MKVCYRALIGTGFPVKVSQHEDAKKLFRVTYDQQVKDNLTYTEAAHEFGECVFHALACEGELDNEGD